MTENDAASDKNRPLPGHETQSGEMACPKCGRFVGAATKCPYCGAKVGKRMSLVALRWAAVLLSTVGLVLLWFMAKTHDPARIRIEEITPTMNFGVVRLAGQVKLARPYKNGNGMYFDVDDGSGEIRVFVHQSLRKAMTDAGLMPRKGDDIDFVAQIQASSEKISVNIRSLDPKSFKLTRADGSPVRRGAAAAKNFGPPVPFSSIDKSLVGKSVVLEGAVASIKEPPADTNRPYVLTLADDTGGIDLKIWPNQYRKISDPQTLTGTVVRAEAEVGLWSNKVDVVLKKGSDLQRVNRAPVPVSTVTAASTNDYVTVVGTLSNPSDLKGKGTSYKLTDDSGSILVVFWTNSIPEELRQKAAAASRVRVNGKVKVFDGTLEVIPAKADGLEILKK